MSAAVACELAEEITAQPDLGRVGRHADGREGALAVLPSATTFSRTSLLCGPAEPDRRSEERAGFTAFWQGRKAALFHKAGLAAGPGRVLNEDVRAALSEPAAIVGVVLNTIDDTLRDGREGSAPSLAARDITYLPELLSAAAGAGRPVVLTSDHGARPRPGGGHPPGHREAARYRQGTPGDGEVLVSGPRVLAAGGTVVLPWDERIRYTARKAGYHGGASLAEMIIPVLVFVPSGSTHPERMGALQHPVLHAPSWWNPAPRQPSRRQRPSQAASAADGPARRQKAGEAGTGQEATLFSAADIARSRPSLGSPGSSPAPLYAAQRAFRPQSASRRSRSPRSSTPWPRQAANCRSVGREARRAAGVPDGRLPRAARPPAQRGWIRGHRDDRRRPHRRAEHPRCFASSSWAAAGDQLRR